MDRSGRRYRAHRKDALIDSPQGGIMGMNRGTSIEDYWRNVELLELASCDPREARIVAYNWLEEACNRRGMVVPLDALVASADAAIELQESSHEDH